ncbi:Vacuolar protein sorting-associated protein 53 [Chytridiales sp. JEL 0842]|nr:Vacuolar protein sorting-associated protein 53 [Chytridiales sp. JEL 0842]
MAATAIAQSPITLSVTPGLVSGRGSPAEITTMSQSQIDLAANQQVEAGDPLDSAGFDPIQYINIIFPNGTHAYVESAEPSLSQIDEVLTKLKEKMNYLDAEMSELIRSQTDNGTTTQKELESCKTAIQELFEKIKQIRVKATASETLVQDITRDIKSLDQSKKNLLHSIAVLKKLQLFASSLEHIKIMSQRRKYIETGQLLKDLEAEAHSQTEQPTQGKFISIISSCFEPYLRLYIEFEDRTLSEMMDTYRASSGTQEDDYVLSSSVDLFLFYRQTLVQCSKLSTKKTFLDLCRLFGKWLRVYSDVLLSKLPKDDKKSYSEDEIKVVCMVLNTADYCNQTICQLEEKLVEKIDEKYKNTVNFGQESEAFVNATGSALKSLVHIIETAIDPALATMMKRPWSSIESVGDQSDYITTIGNALVTSIKPIRKYLSAAKYLKTFWDKVSEAILKKFHANIFKCRYISEVGAEQMLLDTHALKTVLIEMTYIGNDTAEARQPPPPTYMKILGKGILKVEQLLKVILRPHDPPAAIVETYILLFPEGDAASFQKILELKKVMEGKKRKSDQMEAESNGTLTPKRIDELWGDFIKLYSKEEVSLFEKKQFDSALNEGLHLPEKDALITVYVNMKARMKLSEEYRQSQLHNDIINFLKRIHLIGLEGEIQKREEAKRRLEESNRKREEELEESNRRREEAKRRLEETKRKLEETKVEISEKVAAFNLAESFIDALTVAHLRNKDAFSELYDKFQQDSTLKNDVLACLFENKTDSTLSIVTTLNDNADKVRHFIRSDDSVTKLVEMISMSSSGHTEGANLSHETPSAVPSQVSSDATTQDDDIPQTSFEPFMISNIPLVQGHYVKHEIFVRECYVKLISVILKYGVGQPICVSGDPGIGKSFLSLLLFFVLVRHDVDVVRTSLSGYSLRYSKAEKKVYFDLIPSADWMKDDCWLLMDGKAEQKPFAAKTQKAVVFSSPKQSNYHEFVKMDGLTLFMPSWNQDEVEKLVSSFSATETSRLAASFRREQLDEYADLDNSSVVKAVVEKRRKIVGGKVRLLLHIGITTKELEQDLQRKCGALTMKDFTTPYDIDIQGSIPSIVYTVVPSESNGVPFSGKSVKFCSGSAEETIREHLCFKAEDFKNMMYLASKDTPIASALAGYLFETLVHDFFQKGFEGKEFKAKRVVCGKKRAQDGVFKFVKVGPGDGVFEINDDNDLSGKFTISCGVNQVKTFSNKLEQSSTLYQRPLKKNQAVFDGAIYGKAMFQVTVATKHAPTHDNLMKVSKLANTSLLIFFVTQNVYDEFGYQHPTETSSTKKMKKVHKRFQTQYVVCVADELFRKTLPASFGEAAAST